MPFFGKTDPITVLISLLGRALPYLGVLFAGLSLGAFGGTFVERRLVSSIVDAQVSQALMQQNSRDFDDDLKEKLDRELVAFLDVNPFDIPIKPEVIESFSLSQDKTLSEDEKVFSVDGIKVIGSLPNVAAWLDESGVVSLVLKRQEYGGFVLEKISPYSVILSKEGERYEVYISYRDQGKTARSGTKKDSKPKPKPVLTSLTGKQVQPADGDAEGVVARELVDSLLMNPFNELKLVRLIPKFVDDKPVGIEVANIMDGSVLKKLGVEKGDIVKSVNGVSIRNMGDVANAINSLMGGSRFEVAVGRGDKEIMLNYVVR